jgi:uncharacterized repeat protein (TIGR03803 family)
VRKFAIYILFITLSWSFATAQTQYKVLWSFGSVPNDGGFPVSSLILDGKGNLYGTTPAGGAGMFGSGTIFELSPNGDGNWTENILYSFCSIIGCPDGGVPKAGLVFDAAGNLYGTTIGGGAFNCQSGQGGCGTAFELSPPPPSGGPWTETVIYNFCTDGLAGGCQDGAEPTSQLTIDAHGNLYGTTTTGGSGGFMNACCAGGTVFELSRGARGWTHTILYNFCANGQNGVCPDGSGPQAGVAFDKFGNLYGTTEQGGSPAHLGGGTIYKLSPGSSGWTETVLLAEGDPPRGSNPLGEVTVDRFGSLYSTFSYGGGADLAGGVFRLPKTGSATIFTFNISDGQTPSAGVLLDPKTVALYGTTSQGGSAQVGTVFKIVTPAQETVLYNFCSQANCADGSVPLAALVADKSGNLYGTTSLGGANGIGVVFEVTPQNSDPSESRKQFVRSLLTKNGS